MAEINLTGGLTIAELIKREDPDGSMAHLIDIINETNWITRDATFIECNMGTYHEATRTQTEPTGQERGYNQGISAEAGTTQKYNEPTSMIDGLSVVDTALIKHQPDPAGARLTEDGFFLRGMNKTFASRLFDGNRSTSPLQITGINNRSDYNVLSSAQVIDNAGGNASVTANKTSMYMVQWGMKKVDLIFPRNDTPDGSQFGIKMEDMGKELVTDPNDSTKSFPAWRTWFELHFGLFIHDPRCIIRIANISTSNIDGVDDFSVDENKLIDMMAQIEYDGEGAVLYANRTSWSQMRKRAGEKNNAFYMQEDGRFPTAGPILHWDNIPIHRVDKITNTQATVV